MRNITLVVCLTISLIELLLINDVYGQNDQDFARMAAREARRLANTESKCAEQKKALLEYAQNLEQYANNIDRITKGKLAEPYPSMPEVRVVECPETTVNHGDSKNNQDQTDKNGYGGFKDGGTIDLRSPDQKEREKRNKAQDMANQYSDAINNLKSEQQKALNETRGKINDNKNQFSEKYQNKDPTGILNRANQDETSVDDLNLPDYDGRLIDYESSETKATTGSSRNYSVEFERSLRDIDALGRAVLNVEELPGALGGGITRGINAYDNVVNTLDRVQNGDPEFYFEQASSVTDLSTQTNSIIEARIRNGSAAEQMVDDVVTPAIKRSLDENDRMSDAEINQMGSRAENIGWRGLLDHTPLAPIIRRLDAVTSRLAGGGERVENNINNYNSARQIFSDINTITRDGDTADQKARQRLGDVWRSSPEYSTIQVGIVAAYGTMDAFYGAKNTLTSLERVGSKLIDKGVQNYSYKAKEGIDAMQKWFFD